MLIRHSQDIIVHQMSRLAADSLEASQAMVARIRGEQMLKEAIERLDGAGPVQAAPDKRAVDKTV